MEGASAVLFVFGVLALFIMLVIYLERRFPCKCGRMDFPYYPPKHEAGRVMLGYAIFFTVYNAIWIVTMQSVTSVFIGVPIVCYHILRTWRHEKDKIKKAAKGLGRITITQHGTLKVVPE